MKKNELRSLVKVLPVERVVSIYNGLEGMSERQRERDGEKRQRERDRER